MADARAVYRDRPTRVEMDDVLELRTSAVLGTLNDDGSVHLAYVLFLREGDRLFARRPRRPD